MSTITTDLGAVAPVFKAHYASAADMESVTFDILNIISVNGTYYMSLANGNVGNALPTSNTEYNSYWVIVSGISNITIDDVLSTASLNPVNNATIAAAINNLQSQIDQGGGSGGGITVNESDGSITVLTSGSVTVDETDGSITI